MTQKLPTLSEAVDAYQQRGRRLWTDELLVPADIQMLIRLGASPPAAEAFAEIPEEAAKEAARTLARRREEAPRAAAIAVKALAKRKEETQRAFAKRKEEAVQVHAKRLVEEAEQAFAKTAAPETKALFLVDDCVTAHRIATGEHKAQVERLRRAPDYKKMQAKLESVVKDFGALTEDVREAFSVIRTELFYRQLHYEYALRSTSRKGDKTSAQSRAIGWLKGSVRQLSARPNLEHVMTLCDAVLNPAKPILLDAVKRALTPKEWLDRRF